MRRTTDGVAGAGIAMPLWFPSLEDVSGVAAHLVPILSAAWLTVQIVAYIRARWRP